MRYLLTFKPLKNFFFGGKQTLRDDYFAKSEYFPQPTQLLGALRLYIAEQNGLMKTYLNGRYSKSPEELKKLVGEYSSLGQIENLSCMFILNDNLTDAYFQIPFDLHLEFSKDEEQQVALNTATYYQLSNIDNQYYLKGYDAKKYTEPLLGNNNFWISYLKGGDIDKETLAAFFGSSNVTNIFKENSQVGITLDKKQKVDGKFYTKIDYNLEDGFIFGCVIDLQEPIIEDGMITIGADNSLFELKVHQLDTLKLKDHTLIKQLFTQPSDAIKYVALSDMLVESTKDLEAYFTLAPYAKTTVTLLHKRDRFKGKSKAKRVVPAGSVIYPREGCLLPTPEGIYKHIGYNQFIGVKNV